MNSEVQMQLTLRNRTIANNTTQIGTFDSLKQIVKYLHRFLTFIYPAYSGLVYRLNSQRLFLFVSKIDCSPEHHYPDDQETDFSRFRL
jgi:hypothetical protein